MKRKIILGITALTTCFTFQGIAGNSDRTGEAGAYELTINSWARTSGMFGINAARVMGAEAMGSNVGGLSFGKKTQVSLNYSSWLTGTQTSIVQGGFAQEIGSGSVVGLSLMSMSFGDIMRTTTSNPEGGLGTYSPSFLNIGLAYSKAFSNSIHGGVMVKLVNERLDNLQANGIAIDAGLQYVTGKRDATRFGVSIKNFGTPLKFSGDALAFRGESPNGLYSMSLEHRSSKFELPSALIIAGSHDLYVGEDLGNGCNPNNRITIAANFTYNSFNNDQIGLGAEYAYREMFQVRAGYLFERYIFNKELSNKSHIGLAAGFTVEVPFKKDGPSVGIDYSYRPTRYFNGTHTVGFQFNLGNPSGSCGFKTKKSDAFQKDKKGGDKASTAVETTKTLTEEETKKVTEVAKSIKFKTGTDELNKKAMAQLDTLAQIMSKYPKAKVVVEAHTDSTGAPVDDSTTTPELKIENAKKRAEGNLELSKKRAESTKAYIVSKGIAADRVKTLWFGDTKPVAENSTEEGQAQNRRVDIKLEY